jgi:hypothetical protein
VTNILQGKAKASLSNSLNKTIKKRAKPAALLPCIIDDLFFISKKYIASSYNEIIWKI